MAWNVVPLSSITTFFSSIVELELHDLGALLGGLLVRMHEGRRDQFDFLPGQLEVVCGKAGVASMRTAAAALYMAALRVNIGSFLHLEVV